MARVPSSVFDAEGRQITDYRFLFLDDVRTMTHLCLRLLDNRAGARFAPVEQRYGQSIAAHAAHLFFFFFVRVLGPNKWHHIDCGVRTSDEI